jgi:CRISPR-associated protein Csd1
MTILQALDSYYHRLDGVAGPGWSPEKFGWCIVLDGNGEPVDVEDLHDLSATKPRPKLYVVPAAVDRSVNIAPNFFWDKSAYVLGRISGEGKRTAQEHASFVQLHLERLAEQTDEGLVALRRFLENWATEQFDAAPFAPEMLGANIMFRLEGDRNYLHERPAARALIEAISDDETEGGAFCLITGQRAPVALKHPKIKGVESDNPPAGGGHKLVSFNLPAFESYLKEQGANAPTSQAAAFRYGAALNHLLIRDGPNRIRRPIGDATVVFWADAGDAKTEAAEAADAWFAAVLGGDITDEAEARKIGEQLKAVAKGQTLADLRADIEEGTRFHVLGLSPNAARLSVRYWLTGDLDQFAQRLAEHHADLALDPPPAGWGAAPSVNRLLANSTALQGKFENIPPLLAGEVMRAILSGTRYPQSLLAATIIRLRAGDDPLSGWHAAVIRAVLHRDHRIDPKKEDVPMSLAPDEPNKAYQLGRLFAVLETAQRMALGRINATIRDRYFGSASATPASVFPLLLRGAQNHLGKLRKGGKGGWIEREIEDILDKLSLDLPRSLPLAEQGRFAVGYYHQRKDQFKARPDAAAELEAAESDTNEDQGDE